MTKCLQLEFPLDDKTSFEIKLDYIETDLESVRNRCDNMRKGLFKRHNDMQKEIMMLKEEVGWLKNKMKDLLYGKEQWIYKSEGSLFDAREIT